MGNESLSPSAMYDELVAKIVEVVGSTIWSEHRWDDEGFCSHCGISIGTKEWPECRRPITLEDVLRALEARIQKYDETHAPEGKAWFVSGVVDAWHLGRDLAWHRDNAPETIAFLHSLLCNAN